MSADVISTQDIEHEYMPMDDKQECSSVSNLATENFKTKFVTVSHECPEDGGLENLMVRNQCFRAEDISSEEQLYSDKIRDRRSLDSTVTESSSHTGHGCCSQMANKIACIRKQLLEIENKQSNLMDVLQRRWRYGGGDGDGGYSGGGSGGYRGNQGGYGNDNEGSSY